MSPAYNIILADDHVRFRGEIKKILNEMPNIEVVGEAGEGNELFELLERVRPDLVILDISMPNLRAMKATEKIKGKYPAVKVIIMAMDGESEYLSHAISAGADGIFLKQNSARDLTDTIQKVRQGERYFPRWLEEGKGGGDLVKSALPGLPVLPRYY
jgi:DNA-binding NarL/FixJ family response regulator